MGPATLQIWSAICSAVLGRAFCATVSQGTRNRSCGLTFLTPSEAILHSVKASSAPALLPDLFPERVELQSHVSIYSLGRQDILGRDMLDVLFRPANTAEGRHTVRSYR